MLMNYDYQPLTTERVAFTGSILTHIFKTDYIQSHPCHRSTSNGPHNVYTPVKTHRKNVLNFFKFLTLNDVFLSVSWIIHMSNDIHTVLSSG